MTVICRASITLELHICLYNDVDFLAPKFRKQTNKQTATHLPDFWAVVFYTIVVCACTLYYKSIQILFLCSYFEAQNGSLQPAESS